MEIKVNGRHTVVPDAFKQTCEEKLAKIEAVAPKTQIVQVEVSHENNPKLSEVRLRVEITVYGEGPVVRSEAASADALTALDLATAKVFERLRRAHDKVTSKRAARISKLNEKVLEGAGFDVEHLENELKAEARNTKEEAKRQGKELANEEALEGELAVGETVEAQLADTPVTIRRKVHAKENISIAEALERMELVGHDFYLFNNASTGRPAVIYRRKGWSYGVIELA
ncbi:MAG: ribosome-associated translation inhibitor RaiA [Candidatus Ancillula sp.]|jgi:ribosomal subunit interface protein|nr:ribosome-associated translation inhibitor RaiA [Candidatus Ancillula sp.]